MSNCHFFAFLTDDVILSEAKDLISRWLLIYFLYLHKESSKESA